MGVSGVQIFEDDMACVHLAYCLHDIPNPPFEDLRDSLDRAVGCEYMETDLSGEVLTIAILLLSLTRMTVIEGMSEEELAAPYRSQVIQFAHRYQLQWDELKLEDKKELVDMTIESIELKVLNSNCCESYQLWMDTEELDDWIEVVEAIRDELKEIEL